jgi:hypothetical protein
VPVGRVGLGVVSASVTGGNGNAWLGLDSEVDEVFTQHSQRKDGEATRRQPASEVNLKPEVMAGVPKPGVYYS